MMNEATYSLPFPEPRTATRRAQLFRRPERFTPSAETLPWRRFGDLIARCRVDWSIRRGEPIRLGDADTPYEELVDRRGLVRRLLPEIGQSLHLTCRSDDVIEDLTLLRLLDQDHALTIDFLLDHADPSTQNAADIFDAVHTLAEHGLVVRILLLEGSDEVTMRRFFRRAAQAQAFDVRLIDGVQETPGATEVLRLEMGFPMFRAGRG